MADQAEQKIDESVDSEVTFPKLIDMDENRPPPAYQEEKEYVGPNKSDTLNAIYAQN